MGCEDFYAERLDTAEHSLNRTGTGRINCEAPFNLADDVAGGGEFAGGERGGHLATVFGK